MAKMQRSEYERKIELLRRVYPGKVHSDYDTEEATAPQPVHLTETQLAETLEIPKSQIRSILKNREAHLADAKQTNMGLVAEELAAWQIGAFIQRRFKQTELGARITRADILKKLLLTERTFWVVLSVTEDRLHGNELAVATGRRRMSRDSIPFTIRSATTLIDCGYARDTIDEAISSSPFKVPKATHYILATGEFAYTAISGKVGLS